MTSMDKKPGAIRILVVGEPSNIHTGRFVSLLQEIGYDIRIFRSALCCAVDEHIRNAIIYALPPYPGPFHNNTIKILHPVETECGKFHSELLTKIYKFRNELPTLASFFFRDREKDLAKLILKWKPHVVLSIKMQNDGYTVSKVKKMLGNRFKAKWIHFSWGTDLEYYAKHPEQAPDHIPRIKELLSHLDWHIADCKRDTRSAFDFGFKGKALGECLAPGGFDLAYLKRIRAENNENRNVILVKGRHLEGEGRGVAGRSLNILTALHNMADDIRGYKIKIFYASEYTKIIAKYLSAIDGLDYEIVPRVPYRKILELYAQSRIAISASESEGTPSFLLEAMGMGALPIHSDVDSVHDWAQHGDNALFFPLDDINALMSCIRRGLEDDELFEKAQRLNWDIVEERADRRKVAEYVKESIAKVMAAEDAE